MMHVSVLVLFYRLVVLKDGSVHRVHLFLIIYGYIEINVKMGSAPVLKTVHYLSNNTTARAINFFCKDYGLQF